MIGYRNLFVIFSVGILATVSVNQAFAPGEFPPLLNVVKFYDVNANGQYDPGTDQTIRNWKISINGQIQFTPFINFFTPGSQLTVTEFDAIEKNWFATTPKSFTRTMVAGEISSVNFGNLCIGKGNGNTPGFWSGQNGQAIINDGGEVDSEMTLLQNLNLKDDTGADFDPISYDQFRTWLLGANAANMSYMLSAHLAAMALNVESGIVSGTSVLYVPGLTSSGFISINDLIDLANNSLAAGDPKATQESLKNALEQGNNGQNYVQPTPCQFTFKKSSK